MLLTTDKKWSHTRFLADELARRKARNPRYSLRAFAKHLDLDPSAFSRVLKGKQIPTLHKCVEIVQKLQLPQSEAHYFLLSAVEQQLSHLTQVVSEAAHLELKVEPSWSVSRDAMNLAPDNLTVVGPDHKILFVNPAAVAKLSRILGRDLSSGEIIGKTLEGLGMPESFTRQVRDQEMKVLSTGRSDTREMVLEAGPTSIYLERCASPVIGKNGAVQSILEISRDITDRKRTEDERNRLLSRLKALERISTALSVSIDPERIGRIILTEAAAAVGAIHASAHLVCADRDSLDRLVSTGDARLLTSADDRLIPIERPSILCQAVRSRRSVWSSSSESSDAGGKASPAHESRDGHASACAIPLLVDGNCIGVIGFVFTQSRTIDASEREFLQAVANQCARALEGAQRSESHALLAEAG